MATVAETMEGLAERCESAAGPDHELDALIRAAVFAPAGATVTQSPINGAWCIYHGERDGRPRLFEYRGLTSQQRLGEFTASLSAALELVPEGWRTAMVSEMEHQPGWHWRLGQKFGTARFGALPVEGVAVTPALALCAAALRAAAAKAREVRS